MDNPAPAANRPSVWMYLSGLALVYCGLISAQLGIEDQSFITTAMWLSLAGFVFSYTARLNGWFERTTGLFLRWLFAALVLYALLGFWTQGWGLPFDTETAHGGSAIAFLTWIIVFASFALASDEHVLFLIVPVVALMGVTAPAISSHQAFWLFVAVLSNTTFLLVHENSRRLYHSAKHDPALARSQVVVALVCGIVSAIMGTVIGLPLRDTTLRWEGNAPLPQLAMSDNNRGAPGSFSRPTVTVGTGPVSLSDQPVMEVVSSEPLYWRGSVYVHYTGNGWSNPRFAPFVRDLFNPLAPLTNIPERQDGLYTLEVPQTSAPPSRYRVVKQRYRLINGVSNIIYGAAQPVEVRFPNLAVRVDMTGSLNSWYGYRAGTQYEVVSWVPDATPKELRLAPPATRADVSPIYFDLPIRIESRVQRLAKQLTANSTNNYDKVIALKSYIESTCQYNLNAPAVPPGRDAVDFFLFSSKEGYCDLFSTALAVMCRYVDIPARVATGFITGDKLPDGKYLLREKHRHQWTEVYFPGYGWIAFDPTEGAIDSASATRNRNRPWHDFWHLLTQRYGHMPWVMAVLAVSLLLFAVINELSARRFARSAPSRIVHRYLQATRLLQRAGYARQDWVTPTEYAAYIQNELPEVAEPLWALTSLLHRSEYGHGVDELEVHQADHHLQHLREILKRRKRWWRR